MSRVIYPSILFLILGFGLYFPVSAQVDEDQLGAWYMYFWSASVNESPWGFQGDIQVRNWNIAGDLEQLLLRGGVTYTPKATKLKLTFGYAFIATGEPGDGDATVQESRIYQEALLPQTVGKRGFLTHRFRFEQRWVDDQDFRTRFRYNIFINIPFNQPNLKKGAIYLALYNELFVNAQKDIGNGRTVEYFDRNRTYGAIGHSLSDKLRMQLGYMQQTTNAWSKGQLQLSLHHSW
ncbi:MAG: DUF2490 domain-containing protein [Bacteroidota bacterium]